MPTRKKNVAENVERPVTRSRKKEITTYTKIEGADKKSIQVVSRGSLKPDQRQLAELENRFDRIEAKANWRQKSALIVTHLNVFLYSTCFFVQVGTLPYLSKKLGADPATFGQLQTVFAVAQLIGGPIFGRLGDALGDRVALIIAFASSFATYGIMGVSGSIPVLFASRLPSVFMHTMQGSQMLVCRISDEENRASAIARLGFLYGIGMVAGPSVGGYVTSNFGEQEAALLAAAGSLISLVLVVCFLPKGSRRKVDAGSRGLGNIGRIFKVASEPSVIVLLVVKLVCGIPIGILQSMFSVIAIEQFGMEASQTGLMLSYIGAITLFMQGLGVGSLTKRYSESVLMYFSTTTLTSAYFVLTLIVEVNDFLMLLFPLTCSLCMINSILTAAITKAVPAQDAGSVLGLNMAVHSAVRSFAPTVGGYLLQRHGFASLGFSGVACNVVALAILRAKSSVMSTTTKA